MEETLSIVKPDGVEKNLVGEVLRRFESGGMKVIALRMIRMSKAFTRYTERNPFIPA